jgi:hypothetical protein
LTSGSLAWEDFLLSEGSAGARVRPPGEVCVLENTRGFILGLGPLKVRGSAVRGRGVVAPVRKRMDEGSFWRISLTWRSKVSVSCLDLGRAIVEGEPFDCMPRPRRLPMKALRLASSGAEPAWSVTMLGLEDLRLSKGRFGEPNIGEAGLLEHSSWIVGGVGNAATSLSFTGLLEFPSSG